MTAPTTTPPDRLSMDEARRQQQARQQAAAEQARRREDERRERLTDRFRGTLERYGIAWPGDDHVTHRSALASGYSAPDVIVTAGAYLFGYHGSSNTLSVRVEPTDGDLADEDPQWVSCSQVNSNYPLAWLADTWDRGLEQIADARRRRLEREARERARADDPDLDPANRPAPEAYTIDRSSPMGQLIDGLVQVISAAGGHGQLW